MDALKKFILENIIDLSWGEFQGMSDLTIGQLYQLKGLVEGAIAENMAVACSCERCTGLKTESYYKDDGRCIHCGAGDDNHHSYTCPTGLHPDRRQDFQSLDHAYPRHNYKQQEDE